ncbi:hypothetical protein HIM_10942 [Hirsutella minnesotensis 3608]|uniref:Phosphatidylglycerol lysyltransferase C-terminal domain-containing protein n=1 Tax=Hirsutella minnesotensis 3608 TaxID=1043627 RepID=A0A0F8A1S8_9HYPO|nr:hypothetical protein HIM_10942 [Hirsutella minnesotensis 3608]
MTLRGTQQTSGVTTAIPTTVDNTAREVVQRMLWCTKVKPGVNDFSFDCYHSLATSSQTSLSDGSSRRAYSSDGTFGHRCKESEDDDFFRAYLQYSQASHMGVLDPGYKIFTSQRGYGSLLYTIRNRTLVVSGNPLCPPHHFRPLLEELRQFRTANCWRIAFMGVSRTFAEHSQKQGWLVLPFGRERVINPTTNEVLQNKCASKRMASQNRQLLDSKRGGITLGIYAPGINGIELERESELQTIYDDWREERNCKKRGNLQTFVTVFDLFSRRDITFFIYTRDREERINGFAALRTLGASSGFHLDPCIASSSAPRGITDLLVITAMKLLRGPGVSYLSLGYEPFLDLSKVPDKDCATARLAREVYRRVVDSAQLRGKKPYNDKFRPDEELSSGLYIVFPGGTSLLQQAVAVMHVANIKIRRLFV